MICIFIQNCTDQINQATRLKHRRICIAWTGQNIAKQLLSISLSNVGSIATSDNLKSMFAQHLMEQTRLS